MTYSNNKIIIVFHGVGICSKVYIVVDYEKLTYSTEDIAQFQPNLAPAFHWKQALRGGKGSGYKYQGKKKRKAYIIYFTHLPESTEKFIATLLLQALYEIIVITRFYRC